MPFIPMNTFTPSAPIEGCTNAEVDRRDSEATKMISSMELFNECAKYDAQEDIFFGSEENRFWAEREVAPSPTEVDRHERMLALMTGSVPRIGPSELQEAFSAFQASAGKQRMSDASSASLMLALMAETAPYEPDQGSMYELCREMGLYEKWDRPSAPVWASVASALPKPSPASLMLADLAIPYSQDDATVAVIERMLDPIGSVMRAIASLEAEVDAKYCKEVERLMDVYQTRKEQDGDQRARDWLASLPAAKGE